MYTGRTKKIENKNKTQLNMRLRNILLFSPVLLVLLAGCQLSENDRPNIILILADDLGYMDTQSYAERTLGTAKEMMYHETPNIDRLVDEGLAFSRAYATQLCSPTRAAILTGKNPCRIGFTTAAPPLNTYYKANIEVPEDRYAHDGIHGDGNTGNNTRNPWITAIVNTAVPAGTVHDGGKDEISIAEALPDYHSAFIGKWHLGGGGAEGYQPADQGFHPIAWFDMGGSPHFNWRPSWNNKSKRRFPDMPQEEWEMGDAGALTGEDYLTDDLTVQALDYLEERAEMKDEPFFLYFCHYAVHTPLQAKKEDSTYFAGKESRGWNNHDNASYAGMIRALDESVGQILSKLEETGLDENTLVIFMSDNGGLAAKLMPRGWVTDNSPLLGGKGCLTEGGIRVPLIFWRKGKINKNEWCDIPVDCTDLYATIIDAAGYSLENYYDNFKIDGRSLMPLLDDPLNNGQKYDHDTRHWHFPHYVGVRNPFDMKPLTPHSAIMEGNYKLIFDWHGKLRVFDLENDIGEENNLAFEMPDKTMELFGKLISWLESEVELRYWPTLNPDYDPGQQGREDPFVDLVGAYKEGKDILSLLEKPN